MKHLLVLLSFFALTVSAKPIPHHHAKHFAAKHQTTVYICNGPDSKRYHSSPDCRGLTNCSTAVQEVSLDEAVEKGRTPCHICYRINGIKNNNQ